MDTVVLDRANHMADADCQAIEQTGNYSHPVLCGVKLTPFAKGERLVQANAQNEVGGFQFMAGGVEKLVHFVGNPGGPILAHGT